MKTTSFLGLALFLCAHEAFCNEDYEGEDICIVIVVCCARSARLKGTESVAPDLNILADGISIVETVSSFKDVLEPSSFINTISTFNKSNAPQYKNKILNAIERALEYYGAHLSEQSGPDHAFGLATLQSVDDKYGGKLQSKYPLEEWSSTICTKTGSKREGTCRSFLDALRNRNADWNIWKSMEVLEHNAGKFSVGHEKEVVWARMNYECIEALLMRDEVPFVCEKIMFDPVPRSQYMLTHQLLHRILATNTECPAAQRLIDASVDKDLCAKMFQEANLLAQFNVPEVYRDLFSEQVSFCGYIGFPNFFRVEWLDLILSWQSTSDYGCFLQGPQSNEEIFISSDVPILRKLTNMEQKLGIENEENCLRHFTSVSLSALAMFWDYLESI